MMNMFSVNPTPAPTISTAAQPTDNFKNNIKNHITIDIYGKNDLAYGGDVLFIHISDPLDFPDAIPANSTPLNKSNYNILNAFINDKLTADFKNAFNKDINSGTKSILQMGTQTTLGRAKAEVQRKLIVDTNMSDALRTAITSFSTQLNGLMYSSGVTSIPDGEVSAWRILNCTVNYVDTNKENWNTKSVGDVYHIIIGKPTSATTSNVKDISEIRENVKANLAKLVKLIGDDITNMTNAQKGQASSIETLLLKVDSIVDKQLNTLDTNLNGMFAIDAKNTINPGNTKIENNTYRNIWYDANTQLFFKKQTNMYGKSVAGTNPLTGNELVNILTTPFIMQGGKTKKHNKLHKKRNNRKTSKK